MKTRILGDSIGDITQAAMIIQEGGLVAFPTETVYGLGANALDADAVKRVYEAKGRPSDNPMIVHIGRLGQLDQLISRRPKWMDTLAEKFWPGPLTMVLPKSQIVPKTTTGGLYSVAVRFPRHPVAKKLLIAANCPIAAPSANLSGRPSPTTAAHVKEDLLGKIDAVVQAGDCEVGIESTVVDLTGEKPVILRPGAITKSDLERALDTEVELDPSLLLPPRDDIIPKAPGMKYKHYAPKADMIIFRGSQDNIRKAIAAKKASFDGKVGVILFDEDRPEEAAHDLFAKLRDFDDENVDLILAGAIQNTGVGLAVMNRMLKSAGYNVIDV